MRIVYDASGMNVCMYVYSEVCTPRVGSRQASQNKLIWFALLCYCCEVETKEVNYNHFYLTSTKGIIMLYKSCCHWLWFNNLWDSYLFFSPANFFANWITSLELLGGFRFFTTVGRFLTTDNVNATYLSEVSNDHVQWYNMFENYWLIIIIKHNNLQAFLLNLNLIKRQ